MREVLMLAAAGVAIGLGAAWAATRLIQAQLFGIRPTDLATMAAGGHGNCRGGGAVGLRSGAAGDHDRSGACAAVGVGGTGVAGGYRLIEIRGVWGGFGTH